jgi:hypothetical protein
MSPVHAPVNRDKILISKDDYGLAFEHAQLPMVLLGPDLRILDANLLLRELLSRPQEQILGLRIGALVRSDRDEAIDDVLRQLDKNASLSFEGEALTGDGIRVPLLVEIKAIEAPAGRRFLTCLGELVHTKGHEQDAAGARRDRAEEGRLAALSRSLSTERDKDAVIAAICRAAREMAQSDGACLILREGELVHYAQEDTIAHLWAGQRFPITNCISGWSIIHKRPVVIEDIYSDRSNTIAAPS